MGYKMMLRKINGESCQECGGELQSLSDNPNVFTDGEDVECVGRCNKTVGIIFTDEKAHVVYDEQ